MVTYSFWQRYLSFNKKGQIFLMDTPFSSLAPTRLYALLLKLRPLQAGTLMAFNGELVHGAWMHWLGEAAPDVVTWLHNGNKRR